jgi:hypothetical protein
MGVQRFKMYVWKDVSQFQPYFETNQWKIEENSKNAILLHGVLLHVLIDIKISNLKYNNLKNKCSQNGLKEVSNISLEKHDFTFFKS